MYKIIINILFLFFSLFVVGQNCRNIELTEKNDTFYSSSNIKYTGVYEEFFPGDLKTRGSYENGLRNGEFIFFDETGKIIKTEMWVKGIKHGKFELFDYSERLQSVEFFKNGIQDSLNFYFHYSGMLEKILNFKNGNLIDSTVYKVDDKIEKIIAMAPSESNSSVDKIKMIQLDSLSLIAVGIRELGIEDENIIYDTIPMPSLKIISYDISATLYVEKEGAGHIDWGYTFNKNKVPEQQMKALFGKYAREFWIENIIVENKDGYQWKLPSRRITIKNYLSDINK